ncbi:hypothetical protein GCM10027268_14430 [Brachybacterium huguangmaarense]
MGTRLTWSDLPEGVRSRVARVLGEDVVATHGCAGGFSPSTAEVVRGASGAAVFVKAVREADNPDSVALNRQEARVLAEMPGDAPVPALRDVFEDGPWLVLVTEAAPGSMPEQPWRADQLDEVLAAMDALQAAATPCPIGSLPSMADLLGEDLRGFDRVAADPPHDLDPWIAERLDALRSAAQTGIAARAGETLCHGDLRADNIVIAEDGAVALVDWAWASRGSRWADAVDVLSSVELPEGAAAVSARLDAVLERHGVARSVGTQMLAGLLGFFVDAARLPDPPALPGLASHRARRRDLLRELVRERWEDADPPIAVPGTAAPSR